MDTPCLRKSLTLSEFGLGKPNVFANQAYGAPSACNLSAMAKRQGWEHSAENFSSAWLLASAAAHAKDDMGWSGGREAHNLTTDDDD